MAVPRPARVIIISGDQKHQLDLVAGARWIEVAKSVMALQPDRVEALDAKGSLIRVVRPGDQPEDDDEDEDDDEGDLEAIPDAESQRLITFAKLIANAYEHSTNVAFDKLGSLFDAVVRRSESQEKTIGTMDRLVQKLMLEKAASMGASGETSEDGGPLTIESLIGAFLSGKAQSAVEAPPTKTNGVHKETTK
jgi:hypothetical protein